MYHYVLNIKIKGFHVLIDRKSFFDLTAKNEEEAYDKITDMSNNNYYITGTLLDFAYFLKKNKKVCIAIDLSKQTKLKDSQQINFIGKLENQDHGAAMSFVIEKPEEATLNFLQNSVRII